MISIPLKYKKDNVPVLSNEAIEDIIEEVLKDFNPELLDIPQKLDVDRFAEDYLGYDIDYPHLSHNGCIWGKTIFRPSKSIIYDADTCRAEEIPIHRKTILIDAGLTESRRENLYRSTMMHEGSHVIFHEKYFTDSSHRKGVSNHGPFSVCDEADIRGKDSKCIGRWTSHDFIEHHAKRGSAAFLMNRSAMRIFCTDEDIIAESYCESPYNPTLALAKRVSDVFGVSQQSANIRIEALKLGIDDI